MLFYCTFRSNLLTWSLKSNPSMFRKTLSLITSFRRRSEQVSAIMSNDAVLDDTPCHSCPQPCHHHELISSSIASKINQEDPLYPTVKSYQQHVFVIAPKNYRPSEWPSDLLQFKDDECAMRCWSVDKIQTQKDDIVLMKYLALLRVLLDRGTKEKEWKANLTLIENTNHPWLQDCLSSLKSSLSNEGPFNEDDIEFALSILLFPEGIFIPKLSLRHLLYCYHETIPLMDSIKRPDLLTTKLTLATKRQIINEDGMGFIFVCSHLKRDKRCGSIGPKVISAIETWVHEKGLSQTVAIHACSHIGGRGDLFLLWTLSIASLGHKFAGNLILFPPGDWYGRVTPCNVSCLLERHFIQGKITKELYRGSITHEPFFAQSLEF